MRELPVGMEDDMRKRWCRTDGELSMLEEAACRAPKGGARKGPGGHITRGAAVERGWTTNKHKMR